MNTKKVPDAPWLGEIPGHWDVKPLFTVLHERDERNFGIRERNLLSLSYGRIVRKDIDTADGLLPESFDTYQIVEAGDIILRLTDLQNDQRSLRVGLVPERGIITSAYVNLRVQGKHDPRFLFYQLHNADLRKVFYNFGGGVRQSMRYDDLKRLPIVLPPYEEQQLITEHIERESKKVEALIEKNNRLATLLQSKRTSLISAAVWGYSASETAFVEAIPSVPKDWCIQKFKRVAFFQEGPGLRNWQFTDSGTRVICVTNITETGIHFGEYAKFISAREYQEQYMRFTIREGDLLLSSSGNSWGKIAEFHDDGIPTILNTSTIRVNEKTGRPMLRSYIRWVLQSEPVREQLRLAMTGACQPNFGPSHLSEIKVPVPSIDEQARIIDTLDRGTRAIEDLIRKVKECSECLAELKSSVVSSALTSRSDQLRTPSQEAAAACL
jgi:type I restriction enzyme S subunit